MREREELVTKPEIFQVLHDFINARFKLPEKIINIKTNKLETDEERLEAITDSWHDWLKYTEPEIVQAAKNHIIANNIYFPKLHDWAKAIDYYSSNRSFEPIVEFQPFKIVEASPLAQKLFQYYHRGSTKILVRELPSLAEDFVNSAKEIYPDCSEEFIEKNYNELWQLVQSAEQCATCSGIRNCKQEGFKTLSTINKYTGQINLYKEACPDKAFLIREYNERKKRMKETAKAYN